MSYVVDLLEVLLVGVQLAIAFVVGYATANPVATALAALALVRQFGTTVQTGSKGVLFVWGRVRKELEPGFHPLVPVMMAVRKTPVRSITLELPPQRVTTTDGLVYEVRANIVYRVADPKRALTEINNLRHGIETLLALIAADLLRGLTRGAILQVKALEAELRGQAERQLARWGVTVEQAGFTSIAPTKRTLHVTQLALRGAERERTLEALIAHGMSPMAAVALLGADRQLVGHAAARYRALHRTAHLAPAIAATPTAPAELAPRTPLRRPRAQGQPGEPEPTLAAMLADEAPPKTALRPKKTTKGVQPRSWLRLQKRLRHAQAAKPAVYAV